MQPSKSAAKLLRDALFLTRRWQDAQILYDRRGTPEAEEHDDYAFALAEEDTDTGLKKLEILTAPVRLVTWRAEPGRFKQRLASPSLFGTLAMMAARSVADGAPILACEACGSIFIAQDARERYCCATCQTRAVRRRQRERQKTRKDG